MTIKKSNIAPFIAVAVLFYSLFPIYSWGTAVASNSRWFAVAIGAIYVLINFRKLNKKVYCWHFVYAMLIFVSSFMNYQHRTIGEIVNIIMPSVFILEIFLIPEIVVLQNKGKELLSWITVFFIIWLLCVTSSIYTQAGIDAGVYNPYFIGNKFNASYYFILLTCILDIKRKKNPSIQNRIMWIICWGFSLVTIIFMNCSTAIIMLLMIAIAHICVSKKNFLLRHIKWVIIVLIIFATVIILKFDNIISSPVVSKFLSDIGETGTIKSRGIIYTYLPDIIKQKMWLGYGFNSNIVAETFAGNAQNALLHIIVQFGIIGAGVFIIMTASSVKFAVKDKGTDLRPIIYYIIVFILAGIIEITFGFYFYFLLSLLMITGEIQNKENISV